MNVLVAPLELKGTLTAREAAEAMAEGLSDAGWDGGVDLCPLSDGGPGFTDALRTEACLERVTRVPDPLGREVEARWLQRGDTALIEAAAASGLWRLAPSERVPLTASTEGTGCLLRAALEMGCRRIILGAGGSATNDGGTGAARALGIRFLDSAGEVLPPGGAALSRLARIDLSRRDPRLIDVSLEVATDVQNPLLGPIGASAIYGPQKGASPSDVVALEAGLARLAECARELGLPAEDGPRMGAAGGLSFGLASLCGASVTDGFSLAARELLLPQRIRDAELVLTAEGRLDGQSSFGKGPLQLALRCEALDAICVAFVGAIGPDAPLERFDRVVEVSPGLEVEAEDARVVARLALRGAVKRWARGVMRRRPN